MTTPYRLRLILTASRNPKAMVKALREAAETAKLPPELALTWGVRTPGDPIEGTGHRQAMGPTPGGFEAFVELASPQADFDALAEAMDRLLQPVWGHVDRSRSALLAGRHHLLLPRTGPFLMLFALRPKQGMSLPDFFDYWANRHGPLVIEGFGGKGSYYQLHALADESRALAEKLGIGIWDHSGHAGGWLRDPTAVGPSLQTERGLIALEDERQFIEHPASFLAVYELGVEPPAPAG